MSNQFTIRQVETKDVERITILADQLGYSVTKQQLLQRLIKIQNNDTHIFYVATLDHENKYVIGWAHAYICDSITMATYGVLVGLVVDQDYRNQGVGRLLIEKIEDWTARSGGEGVLVRSNIKRKEAHLFYERNGYSNIKQSLTFYKSL